MPESVTAPANPADTQGTRPIPDPTILTTEQLLRSISTLREWVEAQFQVRDERLAGIDRATELRLDGIQSIPGMIDEKVRHLAEVVTAQLTAMNDKLDRFDGLRLELKADSKTQIDAALLAQKEQATLQDQANQKAIDKQNDQNEKASDKLTELFRAEMAALRTEIGGTGRELAALDTRVTKTEASRVGGQEATTERRNANSAIYAAVGFGITILITAITIVGFIVANKP